MSKIKVDTIQSTQHASSTISLTSTGATVNGDCSATNFTGSGANLTSIPAANITGTLPAIDGSALTGVGGGSLEFVKDLSPTTTVNEITETGLDYDTIYRINFNHAQFDWSARIEFFPHLDNQTTKFVPPNSIANCELRRIDINGLAQDTTTDRWNFEMGNYVWQMAGYCEFYTGYRPWIMGAMRPLYTDGFSQFYGRKGVQANTNNDPNQTHQYAKMNGFTINGWGNNYTNESRIYLYKYKKS